MWCSWWGAYSASPLVYTRSYRFICESNSSPDRRGVQWHPYHAQDQGVWALDPPPKDTPELGASASDGKNHIYHVIVSVLSELIGPMLPLSPVHSGQALQQDLGGSCWVEARWEGAWRGLSMALLLCSGATSGALVLGLGLAQLVGVQWHSGEERGQPLLPAHLDCADVTSYKEYKWLMPYGQHNSPKQPLEEGNIIAIPAISHPMS